MIWFAPIWFNELLVNAIKLLVGFSLCLFFITATWLIFHLTKFLITLIKENKLTMLLKEKQNLLILSGSLFALFVLILFYFPQEVIPEKYSIKDISIQFRTASETSERIEIFDRKAIDEFSSIIQGYKCTRTIDLSSQASIDSEVVYIDLTIHESQTNRVFPLHFEVKAGNLIRYTAGNTSFIYRIKDSEHQLENKIFDYAKKHLQF